MYILSYHAHVRLRFKLAAGLGEPWTRDGGIPQRFFGLHFNAGIGNVHLGPDGGCVGFSARNVQTIVCSPGLFLRWCLFEGLGAVVDFVREVVHVEKLQAETTMTR